MKTFVGSALVTGSQDNKPLTFFKMRSEGRWPTVRKYSTLAFLIFFSLAQVFRSPSLVSDEDLRRFLFMLSAGLGLLGGTPTMFALKNNLRFLGFLSLGASLMLIVFGLLGILKVETTPFAKLSGLVLGIVAPLVVILIIMRFKNR